MLWQQMKQTNHHSLFDEQFYYFWRTVKNYHNKVCCIVLIEFLKSIFKVKPSIITGHILLQNLKMFIVCFLLFTYGLIKSDLINFTLRNNKKYQFWWINLKRNIIFSISKYLVNNKKMSL